MAALGLEGLALGFFFFDPFGVAGHEAGVRINSAWGNGAVGRRDWFVQTKDFIDFVDDGVALLGGEVASVVGSRGRRGQGGIGLGLEEGQTVLGQEPGLTELLVVEDGGGQRVAGRDG